MITSPQINHQLERQVRELRARPGWTHPLEAVNGVPVLRREGSLFGKVFRHG